MTRGLWEPEGQQVALPQKAFPAAAVVGARRHTVGPELLPLHHRENKPVFFNSDVRNHYIQ